MKVVICEPGQKARIAEIEANLESYQKTVDGYIEAVYPFEDPVALVCNEESKYNGNAPCRALMMPDGDIYDIVFGTFFICGLGDCDFASLTDELAEKYQKLFQHPEVYMKVNGKIKAFKV